MSRHCECWDEDLECCYCHTTDEGDCVPAVDCGVCVGPLGAVPILLMRDPFLDDINGKLTKLRERQIIQPARPRRPDWFWPALLGSAICVGFGAGETWIAFTGSGSIITGLLLAAIGLFVLSECWPWMKNQQ